MAKSDIRLYYKSQFELGYALRDFIDAYFENKVQDKELEQKIVEIVEANKEKFYKKGTEEIATKPQTILGKTRTEILLKILKKGGDNK